MINQVSYRYHWIRVPLRQWWFDSVTQTTAATVRMTSVAPQWFSFDTGCGGSEWPVDASINPGHRRAPRDITVVRKVALRLPTNTLGWGSVPDTRPS